MKIFLGVLITSLIIFIVWFIITPGFCCSSNFSLEKKNITINDQIISVDVASTPGQQEQGLSGRKSLEKNTGMLFVFPKPGSVGFWMKDMNFSIDMVWLDNTGKVVTIKEHATPEGYPEVFYPTTPAQYVIELPDRDTERLHIEIGQTISI